MVSVDRNNTGFLFKNERKEQDTHADYSGSANYEGEQLWVNAWINTAKDGRKYLSLTFKAKNSRETRVHVRNYGANGVVDPSDDIPF